MANTDACTMFSCSITDLPVNSVSFTLHTRVDDRFFATLVRQQATWRSSVCTPHYLLSVDMYWLAESAS